MKKAIHKSIALVMAVMVLFTTMSFSVNIHYCGEHLIDFSFLQRPDSCSMDHVKAPVKNLCDAMLMQKSCCTDKKFTVKGQHELKVSFEKLSLEQQSFVASFFYSYINLFETLRQRPAHHKNYIPPLLEQDILCLNQTFLI